MKNTFLLISLFLATGLLAQDLIQENTFTGTQGSPLWTPESRTDFTYFNGGDSVETYTRMSKDGKWNNYHHDYKIYNTSKKLIRSFESHWEGPDNFTGAYINEHYTEIVNSSINGKPYIVSTTKYKWYADSMAWDTSEYKYGVIGFVNGVPTIGLQHEVNQLKTRGMPLRNISRMTYGEDNQGKRTHEVYARWQDGAWLNVNSTNLQYPSQSSDPNFIYTSSYTNGGSPVVHLHKTELSYVSVGYLDSVVFSTWDSASMSFLLSNKEKYEYNNIGKLGTKILSGYDPISSTWYNILKTTYTYAQPNAIENHNELTAIQVYPNPVIDLLNLETEIPHTLEVYSTTGQLMSRTTNQSRFSTTSLNSFNAGMYYARIKLSDGQVLTKKVVKK